MRMFKYLVIAVACLLAGAFEASAQKLLLLGQIEQPEKRLDLLASVNLLKPQLPLLEPLQMQVEAESALEAIARRFEVPEYVPDMLDFSQTFLGTRYRRGGKQPGGFDCSGFTGYIFRQFGMTLNASSRSQYTQGDAVEDGDLLPGDLVFFGGRGGSKKVVGHVGIVTEVNPDGTFSFIHSSCSSGVIISKSVEPYYKRRYIGARRVVSED